MNGSPVPDFTLSVIVPTLNAARTLGPTLDALTPQRPGFIKEVVIVDGGSDDETIGIAEEYGCRVVRASKGRGTQLRHGAAAATEEWLLFLHADTRLNADWAKVVSDFVARHGAGQMAAVFQFRLDDDRTADAGSRIGGVVSDPLAGDCRMEIRRFSCRESSTMTSVAFRTFR